MPAFEMVCKKYDGNSQKQSLRAVRKFTHSKQNQSYLSRNYFLLRSYQTGGDVCWRGGEEKRAQQPNGPLFHESSIRGSNIWEK